MANNRGRSLAFADSCTPHRACLVELMDIFIGDRTLCKRSFQNLNVGGAALSFSLKFDNRGSKTKAILAMSSLGPAGARASPLSLKAQSSFCKRPFSFFFLLPFVSWIFVWKTKLQFSEWSQVWKSQQNTYLPRNCRQQMTVLNFTYNFVSISWRFGGKLLY